MQQEKLASHPFHTYDSPRMSVVQKLQRKQRTVIWEEKVDKIAVRLAVEGGFYPEKTNGGVSAFLSELVVAESGSDPRSGLKKHVRQIRAAETALKKKPGK